MEDNIWKFNYLKELAIKHMVRDETSKHGHKILWKRLVDEYNQEYPTKRIYRKMAQTVLFDKVDIEELIFEKYERKEVEALDEDEFSIKKRNVNDRKEEHLEVYSKLSPNVKKSPEYVMEVLGYPTKAWKLMDFKESNYGSLDKPLYAYGIKVKPKVLDDIGVSDIVDALRADIKPLEPIEYERKTSDLTFFLPMTDDHVGHVVFNEELYKKTIEQARADAMEQGVERIVVANLGDFMHVDNTKKTTVAGTQLAVKDDDVYAMWNKGLELMRYAVERLSFVPLKFVYVPGNHSNLVEYGIMNAVKHLYSESEHIEFEVDERVQKAFTIYNTFIGVFHGNMPKKNYTNWAQFEFASLWGSCNRWEQYSGHFHSKDVFTDGGLQHTILGTQKPTDDWEKQQGYGNYRPIVEAYIYEKGKGKSKAFYY